MDQSTVFYGTTCRWLINIHLGKVWVCAVETDRMLESRSECHRREEMGEKKSHCTNPVLGWMDLLLVVRSFTPLTCGENREFPPVADDDVVVGWQICSCDSFLQVSTTPLLGQP